MYAFNYKIKTLKKGRESEKGKNKHTMGPAHMFRNVSSTHLCSENRREKLSNKDPVKGMVQPIWSNTSGSDNVELMIHVLGLTYSSLSKFCNRDIFHVMKFYPL